MPDYLKYCMLYYMSCRNFLFKTATLFDSKIINFITVPYFEMKAIFKNLQLKNLQLKRNFKT